MQKPATKRLIFCTYSSLYSSLVLKKLLASEHIEIVAIVNSTRVISSKYGFIQGAVSQIQLSGWRYASYLFMVTDLFSWLRPSKTVHGLAKKNEIPIIDTADINSTEALNFIQTKKPDFLLAAHFNQLIKTPLLNLACLNIHPSLLPAYKGVDPVFYALLDKNNTIGVTLHKMAKSFDTGQTVLQSECQAKPTDSVFRCNCRLFDEGVKLAINYLSSDSLIRTNKSSQATAVENDYTNDQSYDSWPSREKLSKFRQQGHSLICLKQYQKAILNV